MKISVSSYSFSRYMKATGANYFEICKLAKDMGFEGIELIDLDTSIQSAPDEQTLAKQIKLYCAEIGLPIIAYTIHADFLNLDEARRIKAKADVCDILGAKLLRFDATWQNPEYGWREAIERIAPAMREVAQYAATLGIKTCTENHGYVLQDADRVEQLMLSVGHENYGWLLDIGNFLCADDNPLRCVSIAAKYAFHVHAKDFLYKGADMDAPSGWFKSRGGASLRGTVVGDGVVPVRQCLQILKNSGYDGYVSIEFEGAEENLPALKNGLNFLRGVVDKLN